MTASFDLEAVSGILDRMAAQEGALLPVLHEIQHAYGYVPPQAVPLVAERLNLSRAEVHGVLTYYTHFRQRPAAKTVLQVCRAEACQARGGDLLAAHAERALGCGFHADSADGKVTLEPVYCLGQCACGPAVTLNGDLHARVTPQKLDALLARARSEA